MVEATDLVHLQQLCSHPEFVTPYVDKPVRACGLSIPQILAE
jgi:hypothetical protein